MRKSYLALPLAAGLLLSCSATSKDDQLEAKARDGDPVAACELAARTLHGCALAVQSWEVSKVGPRPACVSKAVFDQQMSYVEKAGNKMKATDGLLYLTGPHMQLLLAAMAVLIEPGNKAVEATTDAQHSCTEFADHMAG